MFIEQVTFIGAFAVLVSVGTVVGGSILNYRGQGNDLVDMGGGLLGVFLWVLWSYGQMNVEKVTQSGEIVRDSNPALAIFGVALAGVMLVFFLWGTTVLVDVRDVQPGRR